MPHLQSVTDATSGGIRPHVGTSATSVGANSVVMGRPIRVLFVDDDAATLAARGDFLAEHERIEVVAESRVADALDRLADDVDCVISDYDMLGTDGIEFCRLIREDRPDLPFVLFTGRRSASVVERALAAGVTDYVPKRCCESPYVLLAHRIERAVDCHRARQRLTERGDD